MPDSSVMVDRRKATRDRRFFGDRRSSVLPNLTDHSRRVAVKDRRSGIDRRMQHREVEAMRLVAILPKS